MQALIRALVHEAFIYNQELGRQFIKEDFHGFQQE